MRRGSTSTRLIVEPSRVLQEMVGALSNPEHDAAMRASRTASKRVASWRTRAARSRLDFVMVTLIFFDNTKSAMMLGGQGCC